MNINTTATTTNFCILFLDFDGVTHPEPCLSADEHCKLPLIESVLRDYPAVKIVISSSWRDHYSLEEMSAFFAPDIASRLIGVTPSIKRPSSNWLPGHVPEFEREWEIESWMKVNCAWDTPWMAIDDRPYWFRPDSANLLVTHSRTAFTLADQVTLRTMLQERL